MSAPVARARLFKAADLAACVAIGNAVDPDHPTSLAAAQHRDATWDAERYDRVRYVAEDATGRVAGWGEVAHEPWQFHPRTYGLRLEVAPHRRRRGLGGALLARLLDALRRRDALLVRTVAAEDDAASTGFLGRRGFVEVWRTLPSRLQVGAFDPVPFAPAAERVARQGVALSTLAAERARDGAVVREVYDLYALCNRGQEELDPVTPPEFAAFVAAELEGPQALPEAWFLARAGGRLVGLSTLERLPGAPDALDVGYSAVHPAYRGRGIALALKLRTVEYAAAHGYREIRTANTAGNARMLAINAAPRLRAGAGAPHVRAAPRQGRTPGGRLRPRRLCVPRSQPDGGARRSPRLHREAPDGPVVRGLGVLDRQAGVDLQGLPAGVPRVGLEQRVVDPLLLEPGQQEVAQAAGVKGSAARGGPPFRPDSLTVVDLAGTLSE